MQHTVTNLINFTNKCDNMKGYNRLKKLALTKASTDQGIPQLQSGSPHDQT